MLIRQVIGALLMVGLLQCLNVLVGFVGLKEIGGRSSEISMAGIQRWYVILVVIKLNRHLPLHAAMGTC